MGEDRRTLYVGEIGTSTNGNLDLLFFKGGLGDEVTEADVREAFIPFGDIVSINMPLDPTSRWSPLQKNMFHLLTHFQKSLPQKKKQKNTKHFASLSLKSTRMPKRQLRTWTRQSCSGVCSKLIRRRLSEIPQDQVTTPYQKPGHKASSLLNSLGRRFMPSQYWQLWLIVVSTFQFGLKTSTWSRELRTSSERKVWFLCFTLFHSHFHCLVVWLLSCEWKAKWKGCCPTEWGFPGFIFWRWGDPNLKTQGKNPLWSNPAKYHF